MDWTKEDKQLEFELKELPKFDLPNEKNQEVLTILQEQSMKMKKGKILTNVTKSITALAAVIVLGFGIWQGNFIKPIVLKSGSGTQQNPSQPQGQSSNVVDQSIVYENTKNSFKIKLPKNWEGRYEVVDRGYKSTDIEKIDFVNIANKGYGGVLFTISIWTTEKWISVGQETAKHIQISKIGEKGDTTFTLSTPSDVQYDQHDEKLKADYQSMYNEIKTIKASFEIKDDSVFSQGAGGDLQWWGLKGGTNPEERTIIGFMNSFLKGDIGVVSNQPAAMDQYFESKNIDVKKNLYRYDGSSGPIVKQVYYSNMVEDSTGTNYLFKTIGESSIQNETFEGTLSIHLNKTSFKIDDLRVTETKPPLGIIHDFPSYLDSNLSNGWRGKINDQYVEVYAGALRNDPTQGIVIKIDHPSNNLDDRQNTGYFTPTKHGTLKIIKEENLKLTLEAKDGTRFIFDLNTLSFSNS